MNNPPCLLISIALFSHNMKALTRNIPPQVRRHLLLMLLLSGCFGLFIFLGFWQLERQTEKTLILKQFTAKQLKKPLTLKALIEQKDPIPYTRLTVKGRYDKKIIYLWDNQFNGRHVGYRVISPFQVKHQKRWLLVDRGWIPRNSKRSQLPTIETPKQLIQLAGTVIEPAHPLLLGAQAENTDKWPIVIQQLRLPWITDHLDHPIFPFVLKLSEKQPGGFIPAFEPVMMPPSKHLAYAVQWFALAITAFILMIIMVFNCYKECGKDGEFTESN